MTDKQSPFRQLSEFFETQRFAVLSTRREDGYPYPNLVAFWADTSCQHIVFCTLRTTQKFANLVADTRVALLMDNRQNDETDLEKAVAVTVLGRCFEAQGDKREELSQRFLAKHPGMVEFVESADCAVMVVTVETYGIVSHFQNVQTRPCALAQADAIGPVD